MPVNNNGPRNPNRAAPPTQPRRPSLVPKGATDRGDGGQKTVNFAAKSEFKRFAKGDTMEASEKAIKTDTKPAVKLSATPRGQVGCVVNVPKSLDEPVVVTWQSGQTYRGSINAKAQPHGEGFLIQDDGTKLKTTWENGRCIGAETGPAALKSIEAYVDRPGNAMRVADRVEAEQAKAKADKAKPQAGAKAPEATSPTPAAPQAAAAAPTTKAATATPARAAAQAPQANKASKKKPADGDKDAGNKASKLGGKIKNAFKAFGRDK